MNQLTFDPIENINWVNFLDKAEKSAKFLPMKNALITGECMDCGRRCVMGYKICSSCRSTNKFKIV